MNIPRQLGQVNSALSQENQSVLAVPQVVAMQQPKADCSLCVKQQTSWDWILAMQQLQFKVMETQAHLQHILQNQCLVPRLWLFQIAKAAYTMQRVWTLLLSVRIRQRPAQLLVWLTQPQFQMRTCWNLM